MRKSDYCRCPVCEWHGEYGDCPHRVPALAGSGRKCPDCGKSKLEQVN